MTAMTTSLENTRASRTQWLITLYAGGGEFCDGYILSIIGVALPLLTVSFSLSAVAAGLLGAASLVGMFFGGLILAYTTYRYLNPAAFAYGSRQLSVVIGGINTGVLLLSSFTVAVSVHAARHGQRRLLVRSRRLDHDLDECEAGRVEPEIGP